MLGASLIVTPAGMFRTQDHALMVGADGQAWGVTADGSAYQVGQKLPFAFPTHDGKTADSTGAFLVGELERLDPTLHMPLAAVSWQRDIDLREDVTIGDEFSSFTQTTFGSAGSLGAGNGIRNGKAWIGKMTDQIGGVGVDTGKTPQPLTPWGLEVKYSLLELASAAQLGRPIDDQKIEALKLKHQMDVDEQVYVGDANIGATGLINATLVTNVANVAATGTGSSPLWSTKTPAQILVDVNELINSVWAASGWAKMPNKIIVPPIQYGLLAANTVSTAGSISTLEFLLKNNVINASGMGKLSIVPSKWCQGAGVGGTIGTVGAHDRMVAYTQEKRLVRFPMTMLQRTPVQYDAIYHKFTYYCRLGIVEVVYPETIGYRDEI